MINTGYMNMEDSVAIELPAQPSTGIVTDESGIEWRRSASDCWDPAPCPSCGARPAGGLSWSELLQQRGRLTAVTG